MPSIDVLAGVPFVDDGFQAELLLAGVSARRAGDAARRGLAKAPDPAAGQWLDPQEAVRVRRNATPVPSGPLTAGQEEAVRTTVDGIVAEMPAWSVLLEALPTRFLLLSTGNGAVSASSFLWPQHVFLAPAAFESTAALREFVVHEMCHQWLYLIEELWDLEVPGAARHVLPSGTANRAPREVIGAAHVAAATIRLYAAAGEHQQLGPLRDYGRGCIALLDQSSDLTGTGRTITNRLREAL
ncbi:HEXXH motif-containing putative peptide modification protein [Kitasatospora sp. NPDC094016]|uniref:aKG-HExxH-type peptide beta-hydroxylase n=1 Tax=Kitasatospora sp. NPDC094016 TaxID=3154986 RepID=UPI00331909EB